MNYNDDKSMMTGVFDSSSNTNCNEYQENNGTLIQYPENDDAEVDPQVDQIDEQQQEMKTILCPPNQLDKCKKLEECLQQELQNQGCYKKQQTQFYICESCNNSYKPEKQYMVYWEKDGALHLYSYNIYSLNAEEVKAILCPHNQKIEFKNLSNDKFLGIKPLQNNNIEKIQKVLYLFQENIQKILQRFFEIPDVSICKICIDYANPEDVDYYIIYHILYGVITKDPNDIYLYNPGEVLAISCPHNQLKLRNFSKDIGHIMLRDNRKVFESFFIDNPRIFKKYFQKFGTQPHFKIQHFNILCKDEELREFIIEFFKIRLYPLLKTSKIDSQNLRRSAFLVNIKHYIKVLSDPSKKLKRNIKN